MIKRIIIALFSIFVLLSFINCNKEEKKPQRSKEQIQWEKSILEHRAKIQKEFKTADDSPFAGRKRITIKRDKPGYVTYFNDKFKFKKEKQEGAIVKIYNKDGKWYFDRIDKKFKLKKDENFEFDTYEIKEDYLKCKFDRFTFVVYPLDNRLVFIVFDPEAKALKEFNGLNYYPPNYDYRVKAKFIIFKDKKQIEMVTSINQIKTFYRYAKIEFEIKGKKRYLIGYKKDLSVKAPEAWIFIPFKDATSGKETYGSGRFIEIKEPTSEEFILDFNLAFNPLCNYSHVYNCALPPEENYLDIPIEAGEKDYHKLHH